MSLVNMPVSEKLREDEGMMRDDFFNSFVSFSSSCSRRTGTVVSLESCSDTRRLFPDGIRPDGWSW